MEEVKQNQYFFVLHTVECATDIHRNYRDFIMVGISFCTSDSLVHKGEGASYASAFAEALLKVAKERVVFHMFNKPLIY